MRTPRLAAAAAVLWLLAPPARAQTAPGSVSSPTADAGTPEPEQITVIGTSPLLGSGVDSTKLPAATTVIRAGDLSRTGTANATRALDETVGSISLDQAVGNAAQPNLLFRGFEASPLAGDAQGIAVYVNGARFNSPFADTTNWDLIPDIAINEIDVLGSNPAFGLNALGGSVAVKLKTGFDSPGGELVAEGGSFGHVDLSGQYGMQRGNYAFYGAAAGMNEDGWRDHSPSQTRQAYGDLGWRDGGQELHLNVTFANNNLIGNGTTPVELLAADRAAVFTYPDETRNRYVRGVLSGNWTLSDQLSLQANAYGSYLDQLTFNGDAGDEGVCTDDTAILCEDDGVTPLTDAGGTPIPNSVRNSPYYTRYGFDDFADGGPYSVLNTTSTRSTAYGATGQATLTMPVLGRPNHLVVGAGFDGASSQFRAATYLGGFTLDRDYVAVPNIEIVQADQSISPVAVRTVNGYTGLFFTDTLDVTSRLFATVSGRYNHATVDLTDELTDTLNGSHAFNRFNIGAGLTYKFTKSLSAYAGYAEANRAPTPSELSCASAASPCSLTNFFVGDPDLGQVVSHTVEAGMDDKQHLAGGLLDLHGGYFRTTNDDDLEFVTATTIGRAYFRNVGTTLRQGAELSADWRTQITRVFASYTYTDAEYRTPLTFSNSDNPAADADGNYQVVPGDRLPGVAAHVLKFGINVKATPRWIVGMTGNFASGQYLFGDEGNQSPTTGSYTVFNFNTSYQLTDRIQIFGSIRNMFDARYATYGTFAPTDSVPIVQAPNATNPRALTPGAPVAGYGGVRFTF